MRCLFFLESGTTHLQCNRRAGSTARESRPLSRRCSCRRQKRQAEPPSATPGPPPRHSPPPSLPQRQRCNCRRAEFLAAGKRRVVAPRSAAVTSALQRRAAGQTAARCWAASPGFGLHARMRSMIKRRPVITDKASAVRSIWPPPSPCEPSMTISGASVMPRLRVACKAAINGAGSRLAQGHKIWG